jgi:TATA-binding protein-associated factor Taf7
MLSGSTPLGLSPQAPISGSKKKKKSSNESASTSVRPSNSAQKPPSKKSSRTKNVTFQTPQPPSSSRHQKTVPAKKVSSDYEKKFEEQQFILRVPNHLAEIIHKILQEADQKDKGKGKDDGSKEKRQELDMDIIFGEHPEVLNFFKCGVPPQLPEEPQQPVNGAEKKSKKQRRREKEEKLEKLMDEAGYLSDVEYGLNSGRVGRFRLKDMTFPCQLVDIPTIVEAYKSMDCNTYYKSGDVSQMILVKDPTSLEAELEELLNAKREITKKQDEKARKRNKKRKRKKEKSQALPKFYQLEHGITPSMHNVLRHWEKQRLNITKKDIEKMVDEFNKMMEDEDPENVQIEIIEEDIKEDESSSEEESSSESEDSALDSDEEEENLMAALEGSGLTVRTASTTTPSPMYSPNSAYTPTPSTPQLSNLQSGVSLMSDQSLSEMSSGGEEDDEMSQDGTTNQTGFLTSQQTQVFRNDGASESGSQSDEDEEEDEEDELMAHFAQAQSSGPSNQLLRSERAQLEGEIITLNRALVHAQGLLAKAPNPMLQQRYRQQALEAEQQIIAKKNRINEIDNSLQQQALELPPF